MKKLLSIIAATAAMVFMSVTTFAVTIPDKPTVPSGTMVTSTADSHGLADTTLASKLDPSWSVASNGVAHMPKHLILISPGSGDSRAVILREDTRPKDAAAVILIKIGTLASTATHSPPGGKAFAQILGTAVINTTNYTKLAQSATGHSALDPTDI